MLISLTVDVLASLLFSAPFFAFFMAKQKKLYLERELSLTPLRICALAVFIAMLAAVFSVTGMPNILYHPIEFRTSFVPFIDIRTSTVQYILNVILFMPLGLLLPLLWHRLRSLLAVAACGFSFTLFIESAQIFTRRATDIDDLLMNTLGAVLGFIIYRLLVIAVPRCAHLFVPGADVTPVKELIFCMMLAFCGMFFLAPFVSDFVYTIIL